MRKLLISLALMSAMNVQVYALEQGAPVIKVQSGDTSYRVSVMEEQIRQLNGRIEELNFQILELQELLRRVQEDNDYRLRELEDKQGNLGSDQNVASTDEGTIRLGKPEPSGETETTQNSDGTQQQASNSTTRTIDGVEIYDGETGQDTNLEGSLGSIQFDADGNIIGTEINKPLDLTSGLNQETDVASVSLPQDADGLFNTGFELVQSGQYADAQRALDLFSQNHSDHPRLPEARFWLGESYLGRSEYKQAAKIYLDAHKKWPNSKYGPQSLLKLGVSIAGLNQRELACATFAEVLTKYPNASRAVKRNVAYEQNAAKCLVN